MHSTALRCGVQDAALNIVRRSDVNPSGGLGCNEQAAAADKLTGDYDFLLVASGKGTHHRLFGGGNAIV